MSKLRLGSNDKTSAGRRDEEDEGNANALELTTLLALDDFTAENGATWIVPGSQNEHPPYRDDFHASAEQVECPAGSLIILNGACTHRSGANKLSASSDRGECTRRTTQHQRRAILTMYLRESVRPNIDPWVSLPTSIQTSCSKRTRRLLGAHWHDFNASQACKRRKHEGKQDDEPVKKVKL